MELGSDPSKVISERLVELVRRVGNNDYAEIDLGGATPESLEPALLVRELARYLFPVVGEAQKVKFKRERDEEANAYAEVFEAGINAFRQADYDEQWRFDNYGLFFGMGTFDSRRKDEKSRLWTPEINGAIRLLNGDFDSLTVTAVYADEVVDSTDYMEFFKKIGRIPTQLHILNHSYISPIVPVSLERFIGQGQFIKPYVDKYVHRELARLTMEGTLPLGTTTNFKEGKIRSVSLFQTEHPDDSGIFVVRSTAPKSEAALGVDNPYGTLSVPKGNVAHLVLTELTEENLDITKRFLRDYCFVSNE